ncbi:DNA-binding response regulator [Zunongwangia sp. F363]|uniref:DNA-binding response regulator n=1 Tax=Autumnicola tepida TaxID=3075595 RepID=A0ABU3C5K8_9FLAO|nr:DNA-binding response regulator [Zunongwangia sp. F363]MDT0641630.1 DNA-binding response regulator [Zunongwangia sp. F363]
MFKKVLIAEDIDAVNTALKKFLLSLGAQEVVYASYCDEAYLKCKKAYQEQSPYELVISDLSFRQDHREEKIRSGEELSLILKKEMPELKIIIHSIEDHPGKVKKIIPYVDGYVCKGRKGMNHLEQAIQQVYGGKSYLSPDIEQTLHHKNVKELSDYDLSILKLLCDGYIQEEISMKFKAQGITPFSKSSIEKKLKDLREEFEAKTNPQLISTVLTLQLI